MALALTLPLIHGTLSLSGVLISVILCSKSRSSAGWRLDSQRKKTQVGVVAVLFHYGQLEEQFSIPLNTGLNTCP